ncbi:SDR family NAD(P)-dependent oxidoreductase [Yoonia sp. R2331]|uniref:SDR family NAD(P)-dependent oxidoreductase n=1 Tax=Yoonia sp. R2331 TaxID=3237238 RepID=UPI0034E60954
MSRALVIGATGGIGSAVCKALAAKEFDVTGLSRRDGLDVTNSDAVDRVLGDLDGPFDLIFVAIGMLGTPEKSLAAITAEEMQRVFAVNTFGVALVLRHVPKLLSKAGRCAILSARVGSIGDNQIGGWHSYRASKAALNQIVKGAAIEMGRSHKGAVVVALHPGTVETSFTAQYAGRHKTVPVDEAADNLLSVIENLEPRQSGGFFDYAGKEVIW